MDYDNGYYFPTQEIVSKVKAEYPKGTKVKLVKMDDVQAPPIGTKGEVMFVDDIGTIFVRWENGSGLGVSYGNDVCKKIS